MPRTIGLILLVCYLIIVGILLITNIRFEAMNLIQGCLAIGAGIFLALGK